MTVAHRLSTIRDSDQIFVFRDGNIVEQGTHEELMDAKNVFFKMVLAQQLDDGSSTQLAEENTLEGMECIAKMMKNLKKQRRRFRNS